MDSITQGLLGAVFAQSIARQKEHIRMAGTVGFLSSIVPDMDLFFKSDSDPLYRLVHHRHFTHSLLFIPIGALLAAGLGWISYRKRSISFKDLYLYSTIAIATHALLDACTSYGTQILLPFTNKRIAWDVVSIIDPIFSLPLFILLILGFIYAKVKFSRIAVIFSLAYLSLCTLSMLQAKSYIVKIANKRGHFPVRVEAKPSMFNSILFRTIYEADDMYHVDAVRVRPFAEHVLYPGGSVRKFVLRTNSIPPTQPPPPGGRRKKIEDESSLFIEPGSVLYNDIKRFVWFSGNMATLRTDGSGYCYVGDMRYGFIPNQIDSLWEIKFKPSEIDKHVERTHRHGLPQRAWDKFFAMLKGQSLPK
ncbi:metal-dependent hydrolase [Elusimicrobiota bacterium]